MAGRFVVKKSKDQYMFDLKAATGEIIATSEWRVAPRQGCEGRGRRSRPAGGKAAPRSAG